jgi:hypothetical protein
MVPYTEIIATVTMIMRAVELWKKFKDKKPVKNELDNMESLVKSPEIVEENKRILTLIPADILDSLEKRVDKCFNRYKEIIDADGEYMSQEIDEATSALLSCVCRELRRIYLINGGIPEGTLSNYWNQYQCSTIE